MQINNYFLLSLFFLIHVHKVAAYYITKERAGHTATLYDDKIYFLGGGIGDGDLQHTNTFFYLDLSIDFDTNNQTSIPFFDLSNTTSTLPKHTGGTTAICGKNKNEIFLWNGDAIGSNGLINYFDFNQQSWNTPNVIDGTQPPRRRRLQSVCDDNGQMYLYGGNVDQDMGLPLQIFNNTDILDTVTSSWGNMSKVNLPGPNNFYTATLLPSGDIVYLGGWRGPPINFVGFTNISLYNVNSNTWSTMTTTGISPSPRDGHAAVLTKDGRIIVSGGEYPNVKPAPQPISILDTTSNPFSWSIPKVAAPSSFPYDQHTATLYGDYMIIAFGMVYDGVNSVRSNKLYIFDVSNLQWITSFKSKFPQSVQIPPPSMNDNKPNVGIIAGIIVAGVVGVIVFVCGILFAYKRYKRRQEYKGVIPTAGSMRINENI